jgi:putative ABC transport system substrate-binding protein
MFSYASVETQVLGLVLRNVTGRPVAEYLREKIWEPMGAEADATWLIDRSGQEATYCCLNAVLRDYARFGLLLAHDGRLGDRQIIPVEEAGRTLRVQVQAVGARTAAELEGAFAAMARARAQAVLVLGNPLFFAERQRVAELAIKHRLPTMSNLKDVVEAGGLMSYSPNWDDLYRRGAVYVDKILRGAKPADLPVEQATKFELVINLKTAQALGLTIPPSLLQRADQVIE